MKEQLDKAIGFFENEIEQYDMILKGDISKEYREYIESLLSHYQIALYALNELLE